MLDQLREWPRDMAAVSFLGARAAAHPRGKPWVIKPMRLNTGTNVGAGGRHKEWDSVNKRVESGGGTVRLADSHKKSTAPGRVACERDFVRHASLGVKVTLTFRLFPLGCTVADGGAISIWLAVGLTVACHLMHKRISASEIAAVASDRLVPMRPCSQTAEGIPGDSRRYLPNSTHSATQFAA